MENNITIRKRSKVSIPVLPTGAKVVEKTERLSLEEIENGFSAYEAIIEASISRLRPIVLTTLTTILGLVPLWYSGGIMWEPMAISIIFGLFVSTILTLIFTPVLYAIFYRIKKD